MKIQKHLTITAAIAAGLSATVLGLAAPAMGAPTADSARATISQLEAQGNRVIVNKLSDTPLSDASVVSVKQGSPIRGTVQDDFNDRTYQQTITGYVYYIDVK